MIRIFAPTARRYRRTQATVVAGAYAITAVRSVQILGDLLTIGH